MTASPPPSQLRSRLTLLLIAAMFLSSFGIAAALFFSGWTPGKGRNVGELLQPPTDLGAVQLKHADGSAYPWAPEENTWRMVAFPAPGCTKQCSRVLDALHRVWLSQGRKAERIDVLWFGPLPEHAPAFGGLHAMQPEPRLASALPEAAGPDALPVYLVDPSGFLALHYHAGFDPNGLRKDLGKLVK